MIWILMFFWKQSFAWLSPSFQLLNLFMQSWAILYSLWCWWLLIKMGTQTVLTKHINTRNRTWENSTLHNWEFFCTLVSFFSASSSSATVNMLIKPKPHNNVSSFKTWRFSDVLYAKQFHFHLLAFPILHRSWSQHLFLQAFWTLWFKWCNC